MKEREDLYFDFSKEEKDYAIRFLLDAVIRSRGNCGMPSNYKDYDEDVNVYLAHLLFAVSTSTYQKLIQKYLVIYPTDLVNLVENADDNYVKYFIYKINADNLLVHLSVFQDLMRNMNMKNNLCGKNEEQFSQTARSYYEQAALFNQRIYRKKTAVGDVLDKLARHFDQYCLILQVTRKDFFHFANRFKDLEFSEFIRNMNDYERNVVLKEKQDTFLDLYQEWVKNKNDESLRERINKLCEEIHQLDSQFQFHV